MNAHCISRIDLPLVPGPSRLARFRSRSRGHSKNYAVVHTDTAVHACSSKNSFERASALVDSSGRPVVLLRLFREAESSGHLPIYSEDQEIVGNVELNFTKPENVKKVIISARGVITGLGRHPKTFVEVSETLWGADLLGHDVCAKSWNAVLSAQLKGYFNWPFSLRLPSHSSATDEAKCHSSCTRSSVQLPPSFFTSELRSSIGYEIILTVKGRHDLTLSVPFIYTPLTRPSSLRDPAYNAQADEGAWEVFRPFVIRGIAFAAYNVDVTCTFALAKPLCYTRGTAIPCVLALESAVAQTVVLLASARAPIVQLRRCAHDAGPGLELKLARIWDAIKPQCALAGHATWRMADGEDDSPGAQAVRKSLGGGSDVHARILVGEIPLAEDLTPSFEFAKMCLTTANAEGRHRIMTNVIKHTRSLNYL